MIQKEKVKKLQAPFKSNLGGERQKCLLLLFSYKNMDNFSHSHNGEKLPKSVDSNHWQMIRTSKPI